MSFTGQRLRATAAAGGKSFRRFLRRDSGNMSVEAVLWLPMFMLLMIVIVDATMVFSRRAQAIRIVQDTNRGMSMYRLTTELEAQDFLLSRIQQFSPTAQASTVYDPTTGLIRTALAMPLHEIDAMGFFDLFPQFQMVIVLFHAREV